MGVRGVLRVIEGGAVGFWCPGCKCHHVVTSDWRFNGDYDRPTFEPSVLVRNGHYATGFKEGQNCWCTYNAEHPDDPVVYTCQRCHSFVRNGMIEFLTDSTHVLAGQTVKIELAPARPGISYE